MTEDEAKVRWCPFARVPPDAAGYAAGNRFDHPKLDGQCLCVASACMAWRWAVDFDDGSGFEQRPSQESAERAARDVNFKRVVGFCGLAGAPQ